MKKIMILIEKFVFYMCYYLVITNVVLSLIHQYI